MSLPNLELSDFSPIYNTGESLETERLVLRPLRKDEDDANALVNIVGDVRTAYWAGMYPIFNKEEALEYIDESISFPESPTFAITIKGEDKVIGGVLLIPQETIYSVGYFISKDHRGQGYTTEAVKAVCDWFFNNTNFDRLLCEIRSDNLPSRRVASKCGFKQNSEQTEWKLNLYQEPLDEFFLFRE